MDVHTGLPTVDEPLDFLKHDGVDAKWPLEFRPVGLVFDECNRLLISSDGMRNVGDGVIVVTYNDTEDENEVEILNSMELSTLNATTIEKVTNNEHSSVMTNTTDFSNSIPNQTNIGKSVTSTSFSIRNDSLSVNMHLTFTIMIILLFRFLFF